VVLEETLYPGRGDSGEREPGNLLLTEEPDPGTLNLLRRSFVQNLTQKDEL
jgi:hypothetical protein